MTAASLLVALISLVDQPSLADQSAAPRIVGGEIKEPRKLKSVPPQYPGAARRAGLAGVVVLECTIAPDGSVTAVKARQGVPPLTDAAIEAVKQWRYTPTLLNGVAVPVVMTVTVNFKLDEVRYHDLLSSLDDPNESIREAASRNLGALRLGGGVGKGDIEKAIHALEPLAERDQDSRVRDAAARSLSRLDGRPLPPAPPEALPKLPAARPRAVAWGAFVDPLGKCAIGEHDGRIDIAVPGGAYDLSIELGSTTAPRLVQRVDGDLVAGVRVDELKEPGLPTVGQPRRAYRGAGLLLWHDERSYVRLESAVTGEGESPVRYALFEVRRDGRVVGGLSGSSVRLQGGPVDLRLERKGGTILALVRQGDEAWREAGRAQIDLPETLEVGIAAVNTAQSGLRAGFSGFELLRGPGAGPAPDRAAEAPPPVPTETGPPPADDDAAPRPLHITRPQYPQEAFAKKIEGTVVVEILIDATGRVTRSRVLQSVPGLDEAALDCVKSWTFTPARKGGKAVPTIAHAPVAFRIGK